MRKEPVVLGGILCVSALVSHYLPGLLHLSTAVVEEAILMILFPISLAFLWWTAERRPAVPVALAVRVKS